MKSIRFLFIPVACMLLLAGCGTTPKDKGIIKVLAPQIEKAIQNAGPFNVDVSLVRKGKAYDVQVELINLTADAADWNKIPPDERVVRFAAVCVVPVGLIAIEHEENVALRNLLITYKNETWSLSIDDCVYFTSNVIAGTMTKKQFNEELLQKLRQTN